MLSLIADNLGIIMFEFLFGGKRKMELIRELLEQRMRNSGFTDMDSRLKVKELGNIQLIGTPEGTIVTIVENVIQLQKQGLLIGQIIDSIEGHRKATGQNSTEFKEIRKLASGSTEVAANAVPAYCFYRINIEYPGRITEEEFGNAFMQATQELMGR